MSASEHRDVRIAAFLVVACAVLYAGIFAWMYHSGTQNGRTVEQLITAGDSGDYMALARMMLDAHRYAISSSSPPEFFRAPGYPAFLAIVFVATGSFALVPLLQLLLTAATVAGIYLVGVQHVPRPVAGAAAVLYMLDPIVVIHSWLALTEPLFMLLLIGALYAAEVGKGRFLPYAVSGALLGLAALVRPVGMYIAPIIALMTVIRLWPRTKTMLAAWALTILCAALVTAPWALRNALLSGHFGISSIGTYNFFYYNIPEFEAQVRGVSAQSVREEFFARLGGESDTYTLRSFAFEAQKAAIVRESLAARPVEYAAFHICKTAPFFFGTSFGTASLIARQLGIVHGEIGPVPNITRMIMSKDWKGATEALTGSVPILLERFGWLFAYLLALFALAHHAIRRSPQAVWFAGALALIAALALLTGPVATPRYRIPAEPFLFLLASAGVAVILTRIRAAVWNKKLTSS